MSLLTFIIGVFLVSYVFWFFSAAYQMDKKGEAGGLTFIVALLLSVLTTMLVVGIKLLL